MTKRKRTSKKAPKAPSPTATAAAGISPYSMGFGAASAMKLLEASPAAAVGYSVLAERLLAELGADWFDGFHAGYIFGLENIPNPEKS